tara:strand:+ start:431 stop:649 length:219 start_codon:yes stop_codon:yes gene_type:complete
MEKMITNNRGRTYLLRINPEYTEYHSKDKFFRFGTEPDKYLICCDWTRDCDTISTHNSYEEALQTLKKIEEA